MLRNHLSAHNREVENLRAMLDEVREKLADAVQEKIDLRVDYENRLNDMKIIHERDVAQMKDQVSMTEKHHENLTSKASLTHISHNKQVQQHTFDVKAIMNEKRSLEEQINNKNKEIETLNQRIQKMEGFQRREVNKL